MALLFNFPRFQMPKILKYDCIPYKCDINIAVMRSKMNVNDYKQMPHVKAFDENPCVLSYCFFFYSFLFILA